MSRILRVLNEKAAPGSHRVQTYLYDIQEGVVFYIDLIDL